MDVKRRHERSNAVFAFGSSTPRYLDPRDEANYLATRRSTSTTNVSGGMEVPLKAPLTDAPAPEKSWQNRCKRATSAQGLDRDAGDDASRSTSAARRRTDIAPVTPSLRVQRAPGRAMSMCRLDQLSRPRTLPSQPLSKGMSRSTAVLSQPRPTRSMLLRQQKLAGARSGVTTPTSRPTSALSQTSSSNHNTPVMRANRVPRKPRPMSIAGSAPSQVDTKLSLKQEGDRPARPASAATKSRSNSTSTPTTPARTARRTPSQVKAESAARKAEKVKADGEEKLKLETEKMEGKRTKTDAQNANKQNRVSLAPKKPKSNPPEPQKKTSKKSSVSIKNELNSDADSKDKKDLSPEPEKCDPEKVVVSSEAVNSSDKSVTHEQNSVQTITSTSEEIVVSSSSSETTTITREVTSSQVEQISSSEVTESQANVQEEKLESKTVKSEEKAAIAEKPVVHEKSATPERNVEVNGSDPKPSTGYSSEQEYKAVLAEKRRQAREAKERALEEERRRIQEEEEREKREEEEMLRLMEEQRKIEEERLQKAIEEAEKQREEEKIKKEQEEKERKDEEEREKIRIREAEEKAKKEEEERERRKSRVAAIMARTRGKKDSSNSSQEAKSGAVTPVEETKPNEALLKASLTDSIIDSMSESMIVGMEQSGDISSLSRSIEEAKDCDNIIEESSQIETNIIKSESTHTESQSAVSNITVVSESSLSSVKETVESTSNTGVEESNVSTTVSVVNQTQEDIISSTLNSSSSTSVTVEADLVTTSETDDSSIETNSLVNIEENSKLDLVHSKNIQNEVDLLGSEFSELQIKKEDQKQLLTNGNIDLIVHTNGHASNGVNHQSYESNNSVDLLGSMCHTPVTCPAPDNNNPEPVPDILL